MDFPFVANTKFVVDITSLATMGKKILMKAKEGFYKQKLLVVMVFTMTQMQKKLV
jgi:hypothetical protein